jgi:anti-sigma factor RsiW
MSRDKSREDAAELISAYVDGVSELAPEDRRSVEAHLAGEPAARTDEAATRALLGQLRAMPHEGDEPDWSAMERSIRAAVGDEVPRPWWRAWRWLVPVMSCATAAAVLLMLWSRPHPRPDRDPTPRPVARGSQPAPAVPVPEAIDEAVVPLWLDGAEVDVDLSAADMLRVPGITDDDAPGEADGDGVALLPASDLEWVDHLDDAAMARAERWLSSGAASPARKKS